MGYLNSTTIKYLPRLALVTDSVIAPHAIVKPFSRLHRVNLSSYSYISTHCHLSYILVGTYVSIGPRVCSINGLHPYSTPSQSPLFHQPKSSLFRQSIHFPIFSDPNQFQKIGASQSLVTIEEDVWIGADVKIMSGVRIGRGSIIGSCSFVNKDIPPYSIAYGIPARVAKSRFSIEQISDLEKAEWWTLPPQAAFHILDKNHKKYNLDTFAD